MTREQLRVAIDTWRYWKTICENAEAGLLHELIKAENYGQPIDDAEVFAILRGSNAAIKASQYPHQRIRFSERKPARTRLTLVGKNGKDLGSKGTA